MNLPLPRSLLHACPEPAERTPRRFKAPSLSRGSLLFLLGTLLAFLPPAARLAAQTAADNDGDGVPNGIETQLGTNPNSAAQSDTTNQTQTKIHRPKL